MRIGDRLRLVRSQGLVVTALLLGLLAMHGLSSQHAMAGMFATADVVHTAAMSSPSGGMHSSVDLAVFGSPQADAAVHAPTLAASPMDQLMADCLAVLSSIVLLLLAFVVVTCRRGNRWTTATSSPHEASLRRPPDRPPPLGSLCVLRV